jgi:hypothetical protein
LTDFSQYSKISREHFSVVALNDQSDKHYWRSRTDAERLEYLQFLRILNYGDAASGRLQRVLEVVKRK